jgi:hypothetical protein
MANQPMVLSVAKLLAKASDADGDILTLTAAGPTSNNGPADNVVLDTNADTITYTPATGFIGSDSFTYTVSDTYGGTVTPTISVTVTASSGLSPNVVSSSYDPGSGTFTVTFAGIPGVAYGIERSPTLSPAAWTRFTTVTAGSNGLFTVTDNAAPPSFYRTVYP